MERRQYHCPTRQENYIILEKKSILRGKKNMRHGIRKHRLKFQFFHSLSAMDKRLNLSFVLLFVKLQGHYI